MMAIARRSWRRLHLRYEAKMLPGYLSWQNTPCPPTVCQELNLPLFFGGGLFPLGGGKAPNSPTVCQELNLPFFLDGAYFLWGGKAPNSPTVCQEPNLSLLFLQGGVQNLFLSVGTMLAKSLNYTSLSPRSTPNARANVKVRGNFLHFPLALFAILSQQDLNSQK